MSLKARTSKPNPVARGLARRARKAGAMPTKKGKGSIYKRHPKHRDDEE
ncbi:hypothetical protein GCM10007420_23440 [Glycocaulis albus]|uniref:Uncharacterized protein n=1 Tax=Glycocaulis albus TaxID=1382801 RepID=A0ABQ1XY21_9PROT|nr:hypothetical protein [Glycocaulis albus]GGH06254.1 hypothetical protein GCM10007420_23440 [Glycocaulis albus]